MRTLAVAACDSFPTTVGSLTVTTVRRLGTGPAPAETSQPEAGSEVHPQDEADE